MVVEVGGAAGRRHECADREASKVGALRGVIQYPNGVNVPLVKLPVAIELRAVNVPDTCHHITVGQVSGSREDVNVEQPGVEDVVDVVEVRVRDDEVIKPGEPASTKGQQGTEGQAGRI